MITSLKKNEIFVFGSNEAGIHGAGAAKQALKWGAKYGVGFGLQGQTFAIPTKDKNIETLPIEKIAKYVDKFIDFAEQHQELIFRVTEIGCGLAGYCSLEIGPLFTRARFMKNVKLSNDFMWVIIHQKTSNDEELD